MRTAQSRWPYGLLLAAAFALLPACSNSDKSAPDTATATATPTKAVLTSVQLLKQGKLDALAKQALPPAEYKHMRSEWTRKHENMKKVSDADRAKFKANMAKLTAPDAKQKLWAEIQPKLQKFDKKYKTQLPMMVGVFQIMMSTQINKSKQLTPDQKEQANQVVGSLAQWAQNAQWTNPDKVKQAIGVLVDSARELDIKTIDQANALPYDQAMKKYGIAWNGFKQVLDIYGLSLDKTLDSVTAKKLSGDADHAKLQVGYTLLETPQTLSMDMVKKDGRWYNQDVLEKWHAQQKKMQAKAAAASSSAATPAAAASSAQ